MTSNTSISATYVYDAENRLIWTSGDRYVYDGDGNRVEKCVAATSTTACPTSGTNGTLYWRGVSGDTQVETDLSGNQLEQYIFFNGQRIARRDISTNSVHYYFSDHLGTHGVVTNAAGTSLEQDIDYFPYGGQQHDYSTAPVAQNYKFNGKERDTESGLDNFGARYDASNLGRFMTPDWAAKPVSVPYANFGNPQSLNLYSYVENNPTTLGDPDGHQDCTGMDWLRCAAPRVAQANDEKEWAESGSSSTDSSQRNHNASRVYRATEKPHTEGDYLYSNDRQVGVARGAIGMQDDPLGNGIIMGGAGILKGVLEAGVDALASLVEGGTGTASKVTFQDILKGAAKDSSGQPAKSGGFAQAAKDFDSIEGQSQTVGRVQVKQLPDGGKAVLRNFSKDGRPTLEYQSPSGGSKTDWIRYNP